MGTSSKQFWQTEFWKNINLLDIAKSAQKCSGKQIVPFFQQLAAYFTSLLYVELWCEKEFGQLQFAANANEAEMLVDSTSHELYEKLMMEIYSNINEPDGIYGINKSQQFQNVIMDSQIVTYEHEGNWANAAGAYLISSSSTYCLDNTVTTSFYNIPGKWIPLESPKVWVYCPR